MPSAKQRLCRTGLKPTQKMYTTLYMGVYYCIMHSRMKRKAFVTVIDLKTVRLEGVAHEP